jgi:hypothetical protein
MDLNNYQTGKTTRDMDKDASGLSLLLYAIVCAGFYRKAIASEKSFLMFFS